MAKCMLATMVFLATLGCGAPAGPPAAAPAAPAPAPTAAPGASLTEVTDARLAVGQSWRYRTRPGDEASRVIIARIEQHAHAGVIVHIAVSAVAVPCRSEPTNVLHLPFQRDALAAELTELDAAQVPLPAFQEGYLMWRDAFERAGAGVFDARLADVIDQLVVTVCEPPK